MFFLLNSSNGQMIDVESPHDHALLQLTTSIVVRTVTVWVGNGTHTRCIADFQKRHRKDDRIFS